MYTNKVYTYGNLPAQRSMVTMTICTPAQAKAISLTKALAAIVGAVMYSEKVNSRGGFMVCWHSAD